MADIEKILKLVTPILTLFVGLFSIILRLHVKRIEDKIKNLNEKIENESKLSKELFEREKHLRDKSEDEMKSLMKYGLENEKNTRLDILKRHDVQISELFDTKVAKEFCNERHKWNGIDRTKILRGEHHD